MVLPFPYRLITAWINNPGPDPFDSPTLEVVEAPWTCQSRPDLGPELSKLWVQLGGNVPLGKAVEAWQSSGFSPRLLHCGSNECLADCVVEWFDARKAHEEQLKHFEYVLRYIEYSVENAEEILPTTFEELIRQNLIDLHDLNDGSGGIRHQELRGTYLVLSIAARGLELLSGPEERISIVKQLAHFVAGIDLMLNEEERTGVRLVDRFNTVINGFERVQSQVLGSGLHATTTTTTTTTTTATATTTTT